jgi:hypothetical protein
MSFGDYRFYEDEQLHEGLKPPVVVDAAGFLTRRRPWMTSGTWRPTRWQSTNLGTRTTNPFQNLFDAQKVLSQPSEFEEEAGVTIL